ncbi:MAG TPA: hypothetical protein VFX15_15455 [Actinomycetes bacterium]|nr:hypothetical protein [Actinomycetes bacterium]
MPHDMHDDMYFDVNGYLTEHISLGGQEVVVHYADIPESDITTVDGIRCTTPLRTMIDLALELDRAEFEEMVRTCLARRLFTPEDAGRRVAQSDMLGHQGAQLLLTVIRRLGGAD